MKPALRSAALLCIAVLAWPGASSAQKPSVNRKIYKQEDPAEPTLRDLLGQGQADLDKKDFAGAVDAYQKYLAQRPEDAAAHFQLAYAFTGLQKPEQAAPEYKRAIDLDPKMSAAYLNLGLLELDHDPARAVEPLRKAAGLLADQPRPRFLLGYALERAGQANAAIQEYQVAEQLDAKNFDVHIALARVLLAANRTPEAESEFRQALAQRPDSGPARLGLAQCLIAQKKPDEASRELKTYLEANPIDAETRVQHASLLFDLGKAEEALGELDRASPAANASVPALKLRADIYASLKKPGDAAVALEKLVTLTPQDAQARARLGQLLMTQKDYAGAVRELSAALHMDAQNNDAWHNLATAYYLSGDYPRSLAALDLLAKREPPTPGIWWVRATCYDKLGRKPEALAAYQKFLELNSNLNSDEYFVAASRARLLQREIRDKKK